MSLLDAELLFNHLDSYTQSAEVYIEPEQVNNTTNKSIDNASKPSKPSKPNTSLTVITGIFLLILAVSGNFVAEVMSCQTQKILSENMYLKHLVIILITYFSLGFSTGESNLSPTELMKQAFYIWAFFLMFNKMEMIYTGLVVSMLTLLLICKNYITYYEKDDAEKYKDSIDALKRTSDYLFNGAIVTTIIGFGLYFKKQHSDYYSSFSYTKFLFGTPKCTGF